MEAKRILVVVIVALVAALALLGGASAQEQVADQSAPDAAGEDEFVIVYGANHEATGKATYASFTLYADKDRWFGLKNSTITSNDYDGAGQPGDLFRLILYGAMRNIILSSAFEATAAAPETRLVH